MFPMDPKNDKQRPLKSLYILSMRFNAESMDVDINEIIMDKLSKNGKKYPVDKSKGNSTKYNKF